MSVKVGDIVEATMAPLVTSDLTPQARDLVGVRLRWTAVRVIDDDESQRYDGQLRMELNEFDYDRTGVWWAPLCDLTDIVVVGHDERVARTWTIIQRS